MTKLTVEGLLKDHIDVPVAYAIYYKGKRASFFFASESRAIIGIVAFFSVSERKAAKEKITQLIKDGKLEIRPI